MQREVKFAMVFEYTTLRECVQKYLKKYGNVTYSGLSNTEVADLLLAADMAVLTGGPRGDDEARASAWFAHIELTKRGIPPTARESLGKIPVSPKTPLQAVRKHDGPYIDLQWLGQNMPNRMPRPWRGISALVYRHDYYGPDDIPLNSPQEIVDGAFAAADRIINRQLSVARKCMQMRLPAARQACMRWLCSQTVKQKLRQIELDSPDLRKRMTGLGIKQLRDKQIERRLVYFKAWKIAGGSNHWQDAAEAFRSLTGEKCTRQGMKDIIGRMKSSKVVRRRRKRTVVGKPVL